MKHQNKLVNKILGKQGSISQPKSNVTESLAPPAPHSTLTTIQITAEDPLFFRDGKPFTMAESTGATGIFPPYPSVFQGAIRSAWFAENPAELKKANNPDDPTGNLRLCGIFLTYNDQRLYPFPANLLLKADPNKPTNPERDEKKTPIYLTLKPIEEAGFLTDLPSDDYCFTFDSPEKPEDTNQAYLTESGFQKYLDHKTDFTEDDWIDLGNYTHREPKTGIGLDPGSGTTQDGMLYQLSQTRLSQQKDKQIGFQLIIGGLTLPHLKGRLRLGGESRSAFYERITFPEPIPKTPSVKAQEIYLLYFLTPGVFDDFEQWLNKLRDGGIDVLTYATARPLLIGGFDLKKGKPKPMRRAVTPGTVVVVRPANADAAYRLKKMHHTAQDIPEYTEQGFGITYVAKSR